MNKYPPEFVVYVATFEELATPTHYRRLWCAVKHADIKRRDWLNAIADCLRDYDGDIRYPCGRKYPIPDIDATFGDDPDMRWMSYYLKSDQSGVSPKGVTRKLERLQLLDLYFKIKHPKVADHFYR